MGRRQLRRRQGGLGRHRGVLERPGHPAQVPAAADDDRLRRARARAPAPPRLRGLHPQAGTGHGGPGPRLVRRHPRPGVRARRVRLRGRHRGAAPHRSDRRHAGRRPRRPGGAARVVRRDAQVAGLARPRRHGGRHAGLRGLQRLHHPGPGRSQGDRQHGRPGRRAVPGRDRRRLARRGLAHPRIPAHPDRG